MAVVNEKLDQVVDFLRDLAQAYMESDTGPASALLAFLVPAVEPHARAAAAADPDLVAAAVAILREGADAFVAWISDDDDRRQLEDLAKGLVLALGRGLGGDPLQRPDLHRGALGGRQEHPGDDDPGHGSPALDGDRPV